MELLFAELKASASVAKKVKLSGILMVLKRAEMLALVLVDN